MRATLDFIGEVTGYWLWLALFWGFLAIIGLGLQTMAGQVALALLIVGLFIKITYGMIAKKESNTYDKTK